MDDLKEAVPVFGSLRLPMIGLFSIIAVTITVVWIIIQYAPWALKSDVAAQSAQQLLINQSILQQLKDLHDQAVILQEGQQDSTDDVIQMEQYLMDRPSTPFQPSFNGRKKYQPHN